MKSILFLIGSLGAGGAERQMVSIASLLKNEGYDVQFLCYHENNFFKGILDSNGIKVRLIKYNNPIEKVFKLYRAVGESHCDVVISMLKMPNFYALVTALGRKHKVITGLRGVPLFPLGKYEIVANLQFRAKYIVSNSINACNVWLKFYPRHKDKFRIIYNTVSVGEVTSIYSPLKDGRLHIIVPASCYAVKNPMGVVKALNLMNVSDRKRIVIEWYGKKETDLNVREETEKVEKFVNDNQLSDSFRLFPPSNDIINIMNTADAIGLFSEREGLPNAICEGMTLGKPIIMTRVSDYKELVDDTNGFLCEWDKPETIKDALLKCRDLEEKDLIEKGMASKEKANSLFSPEKVVSQWIDLIEN